MKLPRLSKRLETIVNHIDCHVLADIGTDHGYTPVAACILGKAAFGIACDVSPGSLKRAEEYIQKMNLSDRIQTRLGYGFSPILPREADSAVISGMGGMLILDILRAGLETVKSLDRLILGPQRDLPALRQGLCEMGILIKDEDMVSEGKQFYNILICGPGRPAPLTPEGRLFGQALLDKSDPALRMYLLKLLEINARICKQAKNTALSEETRLAAEVLVRKGWL